MLAAGKSPLCWQLASPTLKPFVRAHLLSRMHTSISCCGPPTCCSRACCMQATEGRRVTQGSVSSKFHQDTQQQQGLNTQPRPALAPAAAPAAATAAAHQGLTHAAAAAVAAAEAPLVPAAAAAASCRPQGSLVTSCAAAPGLAVATATRCSHTRGLWRSTTDSQSSVLATQVSVVPVPAEARLVPAAGFAAVCPPTHDHEHFWSVGYLLQAPASRSVRTQRVGVCRPSQLQAAADLPTAGE